MSETLSKMARKIHSATQLKQVVRTMKTLAAVNIPIYERAVASLAEYARTIELGLVACCHDQSLTIAQVRNAQKPNRNAAIIFGSDQGLVGDFNERLAQYCAQALKQNQPLSIWPVGDRIFDELSKHNLIAQPALRVADSIAGINRVISQLLTNIDGSGGYDDLTIRIFHNRPTQGRYFEPFQSILLPLDPDWLARLCNGPWPTRVIPETFKPLEQTWSALIREHLFVDIFRACAESLAAENLSRFASMQRAEKNIRELLDRMQFQYNQQRQNSIDEELFDVVVGAEAATDHRIGKT